MKMKTNKKDNFGMAYKSLKNNEMAQFDGKSEVRGHAGRIRGLVCSVLTPRFPVWVLGYVDTQNIGHRV